MAYLPPILVTGSHRSGSTWIGRILAMGPAMRYVDEPFNIEVHGARTGLTRWYTHICPDNEGEYRDFLRFFHLACYHDNPGETPLVKDPIAFFSAPWLARKFGARVVVLIRHPAAFAASLKRLGWTFDFNDLLSQDLLMRDVLAPCRDRIERYAATPPDIISQAAALWDIIYGTASRYRKDEPDWLFMRHEDFCLEPLRYFGKLFTSLGLPYTDDVKRAIESSASRKNPVASPGNAVHHLHRDSRKLVRAWAGSLSTGEIDRVRELTLHSAPSYYSEDDWACSPGD